jgi:uncharacterized membrane protein YagU involved in acid resistance
MARGVVAGAVGTIAMDLVWYIRYRRGGGEASFLSWEFASTPTSWDKASAPARVGKLVYETAMHTELPENQIGVTTNVMHWSYGVQWGVVFAVALGCRRYVKPWHGPLLGALVWLASYISLPIAGFYKPLWSYDLKTLWQDLSAHLVYGVATMAAFWATCRS